MTEEKGDSSYYSIDGAGKEDTNQEETFESLGEKPQLVLRPSWSFRQLRVGISWGTIVVVLFYLTWILIPVLTTGDITSIALNTTLADKTKGFYYGIFVFLLLPFFLLFGLLPIFFNSGTFCFYSNRLEMIPIFSGGRKVTILYGQMHVRLRKGGNSMALAITKQSTPNWAHPLKRYKVLFWDMLLIGGIGLPPPEKIAGIETGVQSPWENPGDLPKAVQILRERAFEFKEG